MRRASKVVVLWVLLCAAVACGAGVNAWTTTGPRSGVTLLASDPVVPARAFAAARTGLYRSLDAGGSWQPTDLALPVQAIAVRGGNPAVVYAAPGDYYVHRSSDGGATWTRLSGLLGWDTSLQGNVVTRLVAPAQRPTDLYVLDRGNLHYSADDGASWARIGSAGPGGDLAVDPGRPGRLYLADGNGLQRSIDNGAIWQSLPYPVAAGSRVKLALDPDAIRLYVLSIDAPDLRRATLRASGDGGATWSTLGAFDVPTGAALSLFAVSPAGDARMRAVIEGAVYASDDGGASWRVLSTSAGERVAAFAFGGDAQTSLLAASVNGVQRSRDGGATWEPRNGGLPGDDVRSLAVGGGSALAYLAAGAAAHRRTAGSNRWDDLEFASPEPEDIIDVWLHPVRGAAYVLHRDHQLRRSEDVGATWGFVKPITAGASSRCTRIVAAQRDDRIVLASGASQIGYSGFEYPGCAVLSLDGGATWRNLDPAIRAGTGGASRGYGVAAIDPRRPDTLWIAAASPFSGDVYRSDDGGITWYLGARPGVATTSPIVGIHIDPDDPMRMYMNAQDGRLYRSGTQGAVWIELAGPPATMRTLVVDWKLPTPTLYAGTTQGVYISSVPGSWVLLPGSARHAVNALALARPQFGSDRLTLVAATTTGVHEFTADPAGRFVPVYRFFNTAAGTHFYTASATERSYVLAQLPAFVDEGTAFWALAAAEPGSTAVYRFFNAQAGTHFYTASAAERDYVLANLPAFLFEGAVYHAFGHGEPGTAPAHRFWNPAGRAHFYTADDDEWLYVRQHFPWFVYEGVTYTVYPAAAGQ